MKLKLAVILVAVFGAALVNADLALESPMQGEKIQDESDLAKRVVPDVKDTIDVSCCEYFKKNGQCNVPAIYKVCKYTCACYNILSDHSCGYLKSKGECKHLYYKKYCRKACNWCPWLTKPATCPSGWKKFNSRCYKFNADKKSWSTARKSCKSQDADLVTVASNAENAFIAKHKAGSVAWIGLHRGSDGKFTKWVDGSSVTFKKWAPGEPNNGKGKKSEKCALIWNRGGGTWNDAVCSDSFGYVCKKCE